MVNTYCQTNDILFLFDENMPCYPCNKHTKNMTSLCFLVVTIHLTEIGFSLL